ncbi:tryptophan synthase beta subunit-like PLP-dependent enzyme [Testicularia cyperi]|uniref:L-serine ammonia-lyase n=1 Tax=Testicularia cyperi TaxID=1882483 RepID=A0A317XQJ2_9BASI|nr:tryptophan synthase beta subunit-like PLP-dependent enzyme [Testicularia cyperi]
MGTISTDTKAENPGSDDGHHIRTALVHSSHLSEQTGHNVYLKMDSDQPSGSFKMRGIGRVVAHAVGEWGREATHIVSSSGGNAGLAVAHAASTAGVGATIFTPASIEPDVVRKLESQGARVVVGGEAWDQADLAARAFCQSHPSRIYVHPFEGELLTDGHSGLVDEVVQQFSALSSPSSSTASPSLSVQDSVEIDAIVSSVGGGGLLRGIIKGCLRTPQFRPTLVAVQNFGTDSFVQSFNRYLEAEADAESSSTPDQSGVVKLQAITSKATSMGTLACSATTLRDAIAYHEATTASPSRSRPQSQSQSQSLGSSASPVQSQSQVETNPDSTAQPNGGITTLTLPDHLSMATCWQFSQLYHEPATRRTVELSCASALTPFFHPWILHALVQSTPALQNKVDSGKAGGGKTRRLNFVVEVCGGSKINPLLLDEYRSTTASRSRGESRESTMVLINGKEVVMPSSSSSSSSPSALPDIATSAN